MISLSKTLRLSLNTVILVVASIIILLAACILYAAAAERYPTVLDLERDLHLARGGQLPRDVQAPDGTIFHVFYVRGNELGNGEYSVIVKLEK